MALKTFPSTDPNFPPERDQVLLLDHAGTGFPTWEVLGNGGAAAGVVTFDGIGLRLISPDVAAQTPGGQSFGASALNRFARPVGERKRVYMIYEWKLRVYRSASAVYTFNKGVEFGLDTSDYGSAADGGVGPGSLAPFAGNRTLVMPRWCMFDETDTTYYGGKWQLTAGSASAPAYRDILDHNGGKFSPTTPGYEGLGGGLNYGKWLRQKSEMVFDLEPETLTGADNIAITTASGSTAASYSGSAIPTVGSPVMGTSVPAGTFVESVNHGAHTLVLSQNASATTSTLAGATLHRPISTARLEGLRHNGVGIGSLPSGGGYSRNPTDNPHWETLLDQQNTPDGSGINVPALSRDMQFQGGLNAYLQIDNRSTQLSKSTLLMTRCQVGVFA